MRYLSDNLDFTAGLCFLFACYVDDLLTSFGLGLNLSPTIAVLAEAESQSIFEYPFSLGWGFHITFLEFMHFTAWVGGWGLTARHLVKKVRAKLHSLRNKT